jgi:LysM repeat protein
MRRENRQLAHYGIPLLFLLAVTIFVLILRGGFGGGGQATGTTGTTKNVRVSSTTTSQPVGKVTVYTVRPGDTLGAIAIHFGVTVNDILALNPGVQPTALRVGQKIKVEAGKKTATP